MQTPKYEQEKPIEEKPIDSNDCLEQRGDELDDPNATAQKNGDETQNAAASIAQLESQIKQLQERCLRECAENDNLRKRQARELQNAYKYGAEKLLKDLLPVMDSMLLGLKSDAEHTLTDNDAHKQFVAGMEMTLKLFEKTLTAHGVEIIDPSGEKFDPERHEALSMIANADMQDNCVLQVTQKGYILNGRVVRAAQVIVVKNN